MNILLNDGSFINDDDFDLRYDMIVIDECESLMNHFDEGTMNHKEVDICYFFTETIKYTPEMVLIDGDISQRSLIFASSFGKMLYVRNNNNETNQEMHVTNDPAIWEDEMYKDIDEFKNMDPNFRICIISQSSKQCMSLNDNIMKKHPELKIKM